MIIYRYPCSVQEHIESDLSGNHLHRKCCRSLKHRQWDLADLTGNQSAHVQQTRVKGGITSPTQ
jgi:hypothetical protein